MDFQIDDAMREKLADVCDADDAQRPHARAAVIGDRPFQRVDTDPEPVVRRQDP